MSFDDDRGGMMEYSIKCRTKRFMEDVTGEHVELMRPYNATKDVAPLLSNFGDRELYESMEPEISMTASEGGVSRAEVNRSFKRSICLKALLNKEVR